MKKTIAFTLTALLMLSLVSCNAESNKPTLVTESGTNVSGATAEPPETSALETNATETFAIGDTVSVGDWNVTVNSFEFLDSIANGDYFSFNPDDGNKYAVANVTVKNVGSSSNTFLKSYSAKDGVSIKYDGQYTYSSTHLLGLDTDLHDQTLNPLTEFSGIIAFSVPNEVVESDGPLTLNLKCDRTEMIINLR